MQPLTPSHFLIGRSAGFQPEITEDERVLSRMDLTHWERLRVDLLDKFWNKWSKEYLTNLRLTVEKCKSQGDISVGYVVLIQEDKVPRMQWLMGFVKDLIKGRDGIVRSAIIKTSKGIRFRAVQRLHDLEVGPGGLENSTTKFDVTKRVPRKLSNDVSSPPDSTSSKTRVNEPSITTENANKAPVMSRYGRKIKPVERFIN